MQVRIAPSDEFDSEGADLPDSFNDEDFDLLAKELWLLGYWAKRENPGLIYVYKESSVPKAQPVGIAAYHKTWHETKWVRDGRPHRLCHAGPSGELTSMPTTASVVVLEER